MKTYHVFKRFEGNKNFERLADIEAHNGPDAIKRVEIRDEYSCRSIRKNLFRKGKIRNFETFGYTGGLLVHFNIVPEL